MLVASFFMSENPNSAPSEENPRKLPKTFEPSSFEERWYRLWEEEGRFQPTGPPGLVKLQLSGLLALAVGQTPPRPIIGPPGSV